MNEIYFADDDMNYCCVGKGEEPPRMRIYKEFISRISFLSLKITDFLDLFNIEINFF